MKNDLSPFYSLDVEADGPCPGLFSMVSFAVVSVKDPSVSFYATLCPISDRFIPEALAVCGFTREQTLSFEPAAEVMARFGQWIADVQPSGRRIIWSDNPAFDWQFLNYYSTAYLDGPNPFGHSARRIGDYWAGKRGRPQETGSWRRFRTCAHTHNALDDARGNAGALAHILSIT